MPAKSGAGVGRVVHLEVVHVHEERLVVVGVRLDVFDRVVGLILVEGGEPFVGDFAEVFGRLAGRAFPLVQVHVFVVIFLEFRIERREPGVEPLVGVVVGVDAGVVGGEILHLVKAVFDRIGFGLVAQMPLAGEVGGIAVLLEELGDRRRLLTEHIRIAGRDDDRQRRADRNAPGDERGAARGAARLSVPVGERRALLGDLIDVRRRMAERLAAVGIGPEIVPARIVRHQHDDVGPLGLRLYVVGARKQSRNRYAPRKSGNCARMMELRSTGSFFG